MPVESLDELRVAVAVEIFGLVPCVNQQAHGPSGYPAEFCYALPDSPGEGGEILDFARDWTALGSLLERMRERGYWWDCGLAWAPKVAGGDWNALVGRLGSYEPLADVHAPTLPEAAARAALEAIRAENGVAR